MLFFVICEILLILQHRLTLLYLLIMILRHIALTIALTLLMLNSFGQQNVLFSESGRKTYLVQYEGYNSYKDQLLNKLSEGTGKSARNTQFTFSYLQEMKITGYANNAEFSVFIKNYELSGDIFYRNFQVSEMLLPNKVSFKMNWKSRRGNVIKAFDFSNVPIRHPATELVSISHIDTFEQKNYSLELVEVNFQYDSYSLSAFESRARMIDEYYQTVKHVEETATRLSNINTENLDQIYEYQTLIEKNNQYIRSTRNRDFFQKLSLSQNDPAGLIRTLNTFERSNQSKSQEVEETIKNLHVAYYNRGVDAQMRGNNPLAEQYFSKSINVNRYYAPPHCQLALLNYEKGNRDEAVRTVKEIVQRMNPDVQTRTKAITLASKIYEEYISESQRSNGNQRFEEALKTLESANFICKNIDGIYCSENMKAEYNRAYQGIYNRIIVQADNAVSAYKFDEAETQVKSARLYQLQNSAYITDASNTNLLMDKICKGYYSQGNDYFNQRNFDNAYERYSAAKRICTDEKNIACPDGLDVKILNTKNAIYQARLTKSEEAYNKNDLDQAEKFLDDAISYQKSNQLEVSKKEEIIQSNIKHKRYINLIQQGIDLANNEQYEQAMLRFDRAKEMEPHYKFNPDPELPVLIDKNAKKFIYQVIEEGERNVKANELQDAQTLYNKAKKLQRLYKYEDNQDIDFSIGKLKDGIFTQECSNLQSAYDSEYNVAVQFIEQKKFIDAEHALIKATKIVQKIPECEIDISGAENKLTQIKPAYNYQLLLDAASKETKSNNFKTATDKYAEADNYYYEYRVEKFGIEHLPLFDYIKQGYNDFVSFGIKYFIEQKSYDKAFELLQELRKRNVSRNWTKIDQTILGGYLATRDYKQNPQAVVKQKVLEYTHDDSWYKYFESAYKKQWKQM